MIAAVDPTSLSSYSSPMEIYDYQEFLKIDSGNEHNLKALNTFNNIVIESSVDNQMNKNFNNIIKDEIYSYLQLFQLGWRAPVAIQTGEDEVWVGHSYVNNIKSGQLCLFRRFKRVVDQEQ